MDRVDLLVNNAASQVTGALDELTGSDWAEMISATFLSALYLTMALRPAMPAVVVSPSGTAYSRLPLD